ncbi:glucokinase [Pelomonas sp. V22]|uniref:glucokinase n=1 Tax=Pelomonas sp. V22 TaxID=2822139 RepID=UPI0024A89E49|nr:glucokinase [Pelomonas sp. V22]MDI4633658.1 glucokinase [Pelomonas sp. V22]
MNRDGLCLVADVGGSNARFGLVERAGGPILHVRSLPVAAHAGLAEAVEAYLEGLPGGADARPLRPRHAAVAVATAVAGDMVEFTNSPWGFSIAAAREGLGLERLLVLNDFEALALSLPRLRPDQLRGSGGLPTPQGTLAVIGPGTGLGVGGVIQTAHGWVALPGEGGHATLAPADDFESELLALVRREHAHVSAERLLSGIGLPVLHAAVARLGGQALAAPLAAEQIVENGIAGQDASCAQTLDVFCALLGGFAGSVALTLGARGGVYIGGGIVPRLGDRFFASRFRERFEAKGRFRSYLEAVPTVLITDTLAALSGAALALEQV